ncbi:MAG: preprotein translocase subunit SecA [Acidimicrobiaceae bacterium]|jgi:hypothetical protein|nr:preprotein translocase subunit SecA [Acidimicrobiaceae bacterium]
MALSDVRVTETETASRATSEPDGALVDALLIAPVWEKQVLEIGVRWDGDEGRLTGDRAWAADRLRMFLLTWDPFEWQPGRPAAFATSTSRADGVGLVLYLPHWQAMAMAGGEAARLPEVLGRLAESVLSVGAEQREAIVDGSYAAGVQAGVLPRMLSRIPDQLEFAPPNITMDSRGWRPIQFDVLEDLAQDDFGPADLDRSPVRFSEPGEGLEAYPGCPGCGGQAVEFPDGLKDTQDAICGTHRAEALRITTARLETAKASNPSGWEALLEAGQRLIEPHLPNGLGPRLVAAAEMDAPGVAELTAHADLVVGAASLMAGLPDPQTPLGGRLTPVRPWLERLPADLDAHGLTDEAARVAPAAQELLTAPSADDLAVAAAAAAQEVDPPKPVPFRRQVRVGRNAPCPCGSGKKYKFCHGTGH